MIFGFVVVLSLKIYILFSQVDLLAEVPELLIYGDIFQSISALYPYDLIYFRVILVIVEVLG